MIIVYVLQGALFFDSLLQKLQTVYQFKFEDYMDGMAIRARPLRKTVLTIILIVCVCLCLNMCSKIYRDICVYIYTVDVWAIKIYLDALKILI